MKAITCLIIIIFILFSYSFADNSKDDIEIIDSIEYEKYLPNGDLVKLHKKETYKKIIKKGSRTGKIYTFWEGKIQYSLRLTKNNNSDVTEIWKKYLDFDRSEITESYPIHWINKIYDVLIDRKTGIILYKKSGRLKVDVFNIEEQNNKTNNYCYQILSFINGGEKMRAAKLVKLKNNFYAFIHYWHRKDKTNDKLHNIYELYKLNDKEPKLVWHEATTPIDLETESKTWWDEEFGKATDKIKEQANNANIKTKNSKPNKENSDNIEIKESIEYEKYLPNGDLVKLHKKETYKKTIKKSMQNDKIFTIWKGVIEYSLILQKKDCTNGSEIWSKELELDKSEITSGLDHIRWINKVYDVLIDNQVGIILYKESNHLMVDVFDVAKQNISGICYSYKLLKSYLGADKMRDGKLTELRNNFYTMIHYMKKLKTDNKIHLIYALYELNEKKPKLLWEKEGRKVSGDYENKTWWDKEFSKSIENSNREKKSTQKSNKLNKNLKNSNNHSETMKNTKSKQNSDSNIDVKNPNADNIVNKNSESNKTNANSNESANGGKKPADSDSQNTGDNVENGSDNENSNNSNPDTANTSYGSNFALYAGGAIGLLILITLILVILPRKKY